ncbi:MAG: hypothetical protein Q4E60_01960 [Bacteroidales bacterium]|nr:hypothetical protein [Bacteroidales bacterium]
MNNAQKYFTIAFLVVSIICLGCTIWIMTILPYDFMHIIMLAAFTFGIVWSSIVLNKMKKNQKK